MAPLTTGGIIAWGLGNMAGSQNTHTTKTEIKQWYLSSLLVYKTVNEKRIFARNSPDNKGQWINM